MFIFKKAHGNLLSNASRKQNAILFCTSKTVRFPSVNGLKGNSCTRSLDLGKLRRMLAVDLTRTSHA